jgi:hypothetical protein
MLTACSVCWTLLNLEGHFFERLDANEAIADEFHLNGFTAAATDECLE